MAIQSPLRPLHNDAEFESALAKYELYFDQEPEPEDSVDAVSLVMAAKGKSQADLADLIGTPTASEILARKRALSLDHVRKIRAEWGVPADVLI